MTTVLDIDYILEEAKSILNRTTDNDAGWCAQRLIEVIGRLKEEEHDAQHPWGPFLDAKMEEAFQRLRKERKKRGLS